MSAQTDRLADIGPLSAGKHASRASGACVMEAVSYVAGEAWSDSPACVSPVISSYLRRWNDELRSADRDRLLRPLIVPLIGTAGGKDVERARSWMALDWLLREHTPAWLRLAGLKADANRLASLSKTSDGPIAVDAAKAAAWSALRLAGLKANADRLASLSKISGLGPIAVDAARAAAWSAYRAVSRATAGDAARATTGVAARAVARATTGATAGDAAWYAARHAAWYATGDAARDAARYAAWCAARDAARYAAWYAAGDAASDALSRTVSELQDSALGLIYRMVRMVEAKAEEGV